jgi:serine/threonine protein kinase
MNDPKFPDELDDRFRLLEPLKTGGQAHVYLCRVRSNHPEANQLAAVKVMHTLGGFNDPADAARRMENEAALLRRLDDHPRLAKLLDHGRLADGRVFIATRYVNGNTLRDWHIGKAGVPEFFLEIGSGPPATPTPASPAPRLSVDAVAERLRIVLDCADALLHAHERGVLHRDIGLSNILVADGVRGALIDFGIARDVHMDKTGPHPGTRPNLCVDLLDGRREHHYNDDVAQLTLALLSVLMTRTAQVYLSRMEQDGDDRLRQVLSLMDLKDEDLAKSIAPTMSEWLSPLRPPKCRPDDEDLTPSWREWIASKLASIEAVATTKIAASPNAITRPQGTAVGMKSKKTQSPTDRTLFIRRAWDQCLEGLQSSFRPFARTLSGATRRPTFFLTLDPVRWNGLYCGLPQIGRRPPVGGFDAYCSNAEATVDASAADWLKLDLVASTVFDALRTSPNLTDLAVDTLLTHDSVRMGHSQSACPGDRGILLGGVPKRTPGWFQDALEFGCLHGSRQSFVRLKEIDGEASFFAFDEAGAQRGVPVGMLRVAKFTKRAGLVKDRVPLFVAEYVMYRASKEQESGVDGSRPLSDFNHFFFPLRSLGQWRTAACWLSDCDGEFDGDVSQFITHSECVHHRAGNLYIDAGASFLTAMAALAGPRRFSPDDRRFALYLAIALFWRASEVRLFSGDAERIRMHGNGDHYAVSPALSPAVRRSSTGFLSVLPGEDGLHTIALDLGLVPGADGFSDIDHVEVDVRLWDPEWTTPDKLGRLSDELQMRLSRAFQMGGAL